MANVIQAPRASRPKGRRRMRPIDGQPLAPVLRLVVNNGNRKPTAQTSQELEALLDKISWHLLQAARAITSYDRGK
ncbi:hypothetical protein [Paraburkholderia hospita]|uniref:hypothetical protein n=1 Tax=Paraburkholderia hospita TaxID=169430 RepID=UPI003ED07059